MTSNNPEVAPDDRRPNIDLDQPQVPHGDGDCLENQPTAGMQLPDVAPAATDSPLRGIVIGALEARPEVSVSEEVQAAGRQGLEEAGTDTQPEYRNFHLPIGKDAEEVFERCLAMKEIQQLLRRLKDLYLPPKGYDESDVAQIILFGLYQAVRDYKIADGNPFYPFAKLCIEARLKDLLKAANREKHRPLNESQRIIKDKDGEVLDNGEFLDELADESLPELSEVVRARSRLDGLLRRFKWAGLSEFEMRCYKGYVNGLSYEEMANEFGVDQKSIDNALSRVWRKIGSLSID